LRTHPVTQSLKASSLRANFWKRQLLKMWTDESYGGMRGGY
jgi:hypothetical protein